VLVGHHEIAQAPAAAGCVTTAYRWVHHVHH